MDRIITHHASDVKLDDFERQAVGGLG